MNENGKDNGNNPIGKVDFLTSGVVGSGVLGFIFAGQQLITPVITQNNQILVKVTRLEGLADRVEVLELRLDGLKKCPK